MASRTCLPFSAQVVERKTSQYSTIIETLKNKATRNTAIFTATKERNVTRVNGKRTGQMSRKISEERRILHKKTPTDATTSRGRKAAGAATARNKAVKEHQDRLQQQHGPEA